MSIGSEIKAAYKKSGLRSIYNKNKSAILNSAALAAAMYTGGALGAPGVLGGGLGALGTTGGLATMAGAIGLGAMRDKKRAKEASLAKQVEAQQRAKDDASNRLDDILGGVVGNPNSPVTGTPDVNYKPVVDPVTGEIVPTDGSLVDTIVGDTPVSGGAANTGGQASTDQQQLIDEAELAMRLQNEQAGKSKEERAKMLQEYADLIVAQQNRILDENAPALYEDLNTRGLLRSSELGNAIGRERQKAAQILQEQVGLQGLNDREAYVKALEDANTGYIQGRSGAIQRRYSLEDFARQAKVAKETGLALQPISTGTPSSKAGDAAMVSAGANVASAVKGK